MKLLKQFKVTRMLVAFQPELLVYSCITIKPILQCTFKEHTYIRIFDKYSLLIVKIEKYSKTAKIRLSELLANSI